MKDFQGFDDTYDVYEIGDDYCSAYDSCEYRDKCDELGFCLVYCEEEGEER